MLLSFFLDGRDGLEVDYECQLHLFESILARFGGSREGQLVEEHRSVSLAELPGEGTCCLSWLASVLVVAVVFQKRAQFSPWRNGVGELCRREVISAEASPIGAAKVRRFGNWLCPLSGVVRPTPRLGSLDTVVSMIQA